jgi:hypothetical protein
METTCAQCWPGKYSGDGAQTCIDCAVDFYSDSWNSSVCTKCPESYTTNGREGQALCQERAVICSAGQEVVDSTCRNCTLGTYSTNGKKCSQCDSGYFSNSTGAPRCEPCPAGRHGIGGVKGAESERDACVDCTKGTYNPFTGRTSCQKCMPGTECPETGMRTFKECGVGSFQVGKSQERCEPCPSGRYVSHKGAAACDLCPSGTSNSMNGSHDNSSCIACIAGRYASQAGQSECTMCADGQFQTDSGRDSCQTCKVVYKDPKMTSNAEHTGCEENKALAMNILSGDVINESGFGLLGAFIVATIFVAFAFGSFYIREKRGAESLAQISRFETFVKSFLPGLSFGNEVFLILTIVTVKPGIGACLVGFRMLHLIGGLILATAIYGPIALSRKLDFVVAGASRIRNDIDLQVSIERTTLIAGIVFLCFCDITMVQFLPWKNGDFAVLSKGYPSMTVLRTCLSIDCLQGVVAVICQLVFLSETNDENSHYLLKLMLALSITSSLVSISLECLLLCLKFNLLHQLVDDDKQHKADAIISKDKIQIHRKSALLDLGIIYDETTDAERISSMAHLGVEIDEEGLEYMSNPLHRTERAAGSIEEQDRRDFMHFAQILRNRKDRDRTSSESEEMKLLLREIAALVSHETLSQTTTTEELAVPEEEPNV